MREYTENGNQLERGKNPELREQKFKIVVCLWEWGDREVTHTLF